MIELSFLIATYNCVQDVPHLARVVQAWAGLPVEFCVADGGSSDGTADAVRAIPGVRLVASRPDRGIYDAWNRAVVAAHGEYLAFIGIDDTPMPEFFHCVRTKLADSAQRPGVLFGHAVLVRGRRRRLWLSPEHPRLFAGEDIDFDFPHPGSYNHRSLFEGAGFDPDFRLAGDFDFYLHARKRAGFTWCRVDAVQAMIGTDGASRSPGSSQIYRTERARAAERSGLRIAPPTLGRQLIEAIERFPRLFALMKDVAWLIRGRVS